MIFKSRSSFTPILLLPISVLVIGCQPEVEVGQQTAQVSGSIWLDGNPMANAQILLIPTRYSEQNGYSQSMSHGATDEQGDFQLTMLGSEMRGAAVGEHFVLISKQRKASDRSPETRLKQAALAMEFLKQSDEFGDDRLPIALAESDPDELIPLIYNRLSILRCQVKAAGTRIRFNLTSKDPLLSSKVPKRALVEYLSSE